MKKDMQVNLNARLAMCALVSVVLSACGGSGGADSDPLNAIILDDSVQASGNASIPEDPGTSEFTPSPGNGLPITFQGPGQGVLSNDDFIDAQWEHMQNCLLVSAQEPVIVVVEGELNPADPNDDVIRHIDGQLQASSHVTGTSVTIQVRAADFDGSLGREGAYLRSIMGRYLWLANSLAERDYPYDCANGN